MTNEKELREELLQKGKELGLHLGYANKLDEFVDLFLSKLHSHTKEVKVDLLKKYNYFLQKNGYIDTNYITEIQQQTDRFLASLEDNKK